MKIGLIIPHKNDRPAFLRNCFRMIDAQTIQPEIVELVNDESPYNGCDITWRYRIGYERLRNKGLDVIFLIEDDDWYSPDYLEHLIGAWRQNGNPDIFGTRYTIYYHILYKCHFTMHHADRASAMNTLIKPDLHFNWCNDTDRYTDMHLWSTLKGITFNPERIISVGIKHGVGLTGGDTHTNKLHRYKEKTLNLSEVMDKESFEFYSNYFDNNPDDHKEVMKKINDNNKISPEYQKLRI